MDVIDPYDLHKLRMNRAHLGYSRDANVCQNSTP